MIVGFEVVNKSFIPVLSAMFGLVLALCLQPLLWPYVLTGIFLFPGFMLALSAVSLLLVVLMPDVDDPTQRFLRGLATLLGIAACAGPPVLVLGLLLFLKVPIALASIPTAGVMVGLAWLMTHFAGKIYEDFNPAD